MTSRRIIPLLLSLTLAGCLETSGPDPVPSGQGILLLHAFGALPGITETDTIATSDRIPLPPEFDGGAMRLHRDTVLTASSGWSGDNRLYLADVRTSTLFSAELPAGANAAGAALASGFRSARAAVALRSRASVGLVSITPDGAEVTEIGDVGRCPYDVSMHSAGLWVVDHNAACDGDYSSLGDSRLILVGIRSARDTLELPGVPHATSILVAGNLAWVASIGVTSYGAGGAPTFARPGAITLVDLINQSVLFTRELPQGTSGASMRMGLDGFLYVTAYINTAYETGVFRMERESLIFTGIRVAGQQHLRLLDGAGQPVACAAATADRYGRIYCAVNQGAGSATSLVTFSPAGTELHRFATGGTGAVDIAIRP